MSSLIGRLCANRQDEPVFANCIQPFLTECEQNYVARRVVARLFEQMKDSQLEVLIGQLLTKAEKVDQLVWCLGERILRPRVGYLLTSKLLTSLPSKPGHAYVCNLIAYLAHSRQHFLDAFCNTLELWCNASVVKRLPDDHHFYICTLLATFLVHFKTGNHEIDKSKFFQKCMHGVETHLYRVESSKRNSGLFVGQNLCNFWSKEKSDLIDFEVPIDDKVQILKNILEGQQNDKMDKKKDETNEAKLMPENPIDVQDRKSIKNEDDEDDDDLKPMDMSHDVPKEQQKRPFYLKDCLDGLTNNEDVEWQLRCLQDCEQLMLNNKLQTQDLAVDLARALLLMNIDEQQYLPYRTQCLIRLGAMVPNQVGAFLINQFYDQNLAIINKLDVLHALSGIVKELSALQIEADSDSNTNSPLTSLHQITQGTKAMADKLDQDWQTIVQRRIQSKTRVFASASRPLHGRQNKIVDVIHFFYFPLLNRYKKEELKNLKLEGEDYSVLSRMFVTLADFMRSVNQLHVTRNMFMPLFEFIQHFRNHTER